MYVRNIAGYNFSFMYRGNVMYIPYDGKIYSIPDDAGKYRELKRILPMHVRTQEVVYLRVDGKISNGQKRRGRPKGSTKKSNTVSKENNMDNTSTPVVDDTPKNTDVFTVDVDLDSIVDDLVNKALETVKSEPKQDVTKEEEPKTKTKSSSKKKSSTKKKSSSKRKTSTKKKSTDKK